MQASARPIRTATLAVRTLLHVGCDDGRQLTLATHEQGNSLARIGGYIAEVLERERGWEVEVLVGKDYNAASNIERVANGEVDLALTSTILPPEREYNVATLLPLYQEILVLLFDPSIGEPASLQELLDGRRVGVGPRELQHSSVVLEILEGFGVARDRFTPVYTPLGEMRITSGKMDAFITLLGTGPARIRSELAAGMQLFSFDDVELANRGSRVDGFLLRNPAYQSFILPKNAFGRYPSEPVLTLEAMVTLVAHEDLPASVAYDIVESLIGNTNRLARRDPLLWRRSTSIDESTLNFPLHSGTRYFLNRDEPSFLERFAEVIALGVSLVVLSLGAMRSANEILRRRRKGRIDGYYRAVQEIEQRGGGCPEELGERLRELKELESRALDQLQAERLDANASFSIFLDLVRSTTARIEAEFTRRSGKG
jgi:TRAP-type uncharacterized transport system substrate-binding protein